GRQAVSPPLLPVCYHRRHRRYSTRSEQSHDADREVEILFAAALRSSSPSSSSSTGRISSSRRSRRRLRPHRIQPGYLEGQPSHLQRIGGKDVQARLYSGPAQVDNYIERRTRFLHLPGERLDDRVDGGFGVSPSDDERSESNCS